MAFASCSIFNDQKLINWKECVLEKKDEDILSAKLRLLWKENSA